MPLATDFYGHLCEATTLLLEFSSWRQRLDVPIA